MLQTVRIFLLCSLLSFGVTAQESDRSMAISISPISAILGSADVLFQYKVASFLSITLPATFSYYWTLPFALNLVSSKGQKFETSKAPFLLAGGLGARFYPTGKGMNDGFYLEPRVSVAYFQAGAQAKGFGRIEWQRTTLIPKLNFGWDWFYDSGFYTSLGAGVGYGYDVSVDLYVSPDLRDAMKTASRFLPIVPNPESKGSFVWDLEYKIGFSW